MWSFPCAESCPLSSPDIASGGGELWTIGYAYQTVAEISTAGTLTPFLVPTFASQPNVMTVGGDGNVWFTDFANVIAKVLTHT